MPVTCGRGLEIPAGQENMFTRTEEETGHHTVIAAELTESLVARLARSRASHSPQLLVGLLHLVPLQGYDGFSDFAADGTCRA